MDRNITLGACLSYRGRSRQTEDSSGAASDRRRSIRSWRIYARSASDDKAGVMAILTAFTCVERQRRRADFEHQVLLRRRGRSRLATSRRDHRSHIKICSPPMRGSSVMDQCTSQDVSRLCLARAGIRTSMSPSTPRNVLCTAVTTATGRPTRPICLPACSRP